MKTRTVLALAMFLVLVVTGSAPVAAGDAQVPFKTTIQLGMAKPALAPTVVRGRIRCRGAAAEQVTVVVAGHSTQANSDGSFEITANFTSTPARVFVAYDANIRLSPAASSPRPRLQVMNDAHGTRNESVDQPPTVTGDVGNFGSVELRGNDCVLWNFGVEALTYYFATLNALPPAGELRIKRWEAVYISRSAAPHSFYDYIAAPADLATYGTARDRRRIFFHEFGHTIRHVADGNETHWHGDNVRYIYARAHNGSQVTNKAFVFNEGWAHYWATAVLGGSHPQNPKVSEAEFLEWNEDLIGEYLHQMSAAIGSGSAGPAFMVRLLTSNPGRIHTLYQFEQRYCAALGTSASNTYCRNGVPRRTKPASCPPGYNDDGATCRLENILAKPSYGRGAGVPPESCGAGREYDAGLCYPLCPRGYHGVGPVCWQDCPAGYHDDGATCRRDAKVISADNDACPGYDKCGLWRKNRGCSVCPAGYSNDGCTCRIDADIFGKKSQKRGAGKVPTGCASGQQLDAGLCYPQCRAGYSGVGPVCWGSCLADFADRGATCYREPNIFSDD